MSSTAFQAEQKYPPVVVSVLANLSTVLFLFFIDEGNFDFSWASNPGGWFAFFYYFLGILFCQCVVYLFVLRSYKGQYKNTLSSVIGIPVGLALVMLSFLLM